MATKKRMRGKPTAAEKAMGVQSKTTALAQDFFSNLLARTGAGSTSLENGSSYEITRWTLNYWSVLSFFETSWIFRRIVVAPAEDIVKTWPKMLGELDPKAQALVDRAIRKTNTKNQLLEALIWGRLFGGAGALIVVKGDENKLDEPLDLDALPLHSYRGLTVFDRWSGITPSSEVCSDIERPLDFGLPEYYDCRGRDGASFRVHSSRILRFTGPMMPEPEKSAYSGWGMSVGAPIVQTITSFDNVSYNALSLSYRAQIIGMRMPQLAEMLSGLGANQASAQRFQQRMQSVNEMLSNQSLVLLPQDGELTTTNYSFSGMYELLQAFQLQVAGAAKMPVSLLWGRTLNGLGQAGDGDERIYEKTIDTESNTTLRPALDKLYPVICTSELGEVPEDMELDFPSIRVLTETEKATLAKDTVDAITVCINTGIMSPRTGGKELKQSSTQTGFGTNLTDEDIEKLSDDVQSEGELGEGLFGGEGGGLTPADSPAGAIKESDKVGKAKAAMETQAPLAKPVVKAQARDEDGPGPVRYVHGIECVIETPKGGMRSGPGWETVMPAHYGYIKGVQGADGDSLDCYIGPESNGWAYVVDQATLDGKKFDEHKVMLNFPSATRALNTYRAGHHKAEDIMLDWTPMPVAEFKQWMRTANLQRPCSPAVKLR